MPSRKKKPEQCDDLEVCVTKEGFLTKRVKGQHRDRLGEETEDLSRYQDRIDALVLNALGHEWD